MDWARIDAETLPLVKKTIASLEGNDNHRPERITVTGVAKRLGMQVTHFRRLPCFYEFAERHACTVEEHRAKKLVWAVRKVDRDGLVLNKQRMFELVHLDERAICTALPYLRSYADEGTCEMIRELVE